MLLFAPKNLLVLTLTCVSTTLEEWWSFEFAGVHLITYGLVASGFLLLLVNGVVGGHFGSIEASKLELLELEERYDREDYGI